MTTTYSYEPLDTSQASLRLLHIQQASSDHQIHCSIRNATVAATPYVALSYMWHPNGIQSDNVQHLIQLNGQPFGVAENLWSFLNIAQQELYGNEIWIDAVCIEQTNHAERNHQVGCMHQIYSNAASVLVWLGPGDGSTQMFFDFVNNGSWTSMFLQRGEYLINPSEFRPSKPDTIEDLTLRDGIYQLIRNPYWGRMWIVQELLLAKRIQIMMGAHQIDWGTFFGAMDIQEHAGSAESRGGGKRMAHVRLFRDNPDGMIAPSTLEGLVTYFEGQTCSDPRDRVYALLGIANERKDFVVDYDATPEQVIEYTLKRIQIRSFLSAPAIIRALGIPPAEAAIRLSATFLNGSFIDDQRSRYVNVKSTQGNKARTVSAVPEEWPTEGRSFTIVNCSCVACLPKAELLTPQDGDVVANLPRSELLVLCRRNPGTAVFDCVGCLGFSSRFQFGHDHSYSCFTPYEEVGKLCVKFAGNGSYTNNSGGQTLTWDLNWRTILAISEHARLGKKPGLVALNGPRPHDVWKHAFA